MSPLPVITEPERARNADLSTRVVHAAPLIHAEEEWEKSATTTPIGAGEHYSTITEDSPISVRLIAA